ncbi:NAD/NADP octopine/nopaline dehydrogenase family protein [Acetivibrio clariflavus]|uniref:NAD/NADP-dependent octopine/nopaline dehydrogenase family protein n=1 Tax=Acetivibrio clariflavus TaxID=288965 RepID=UPI0031F52D83
MNVTIIGAGNSGLAMAAHLSAEGNRVTIWNRTLSNIEKLKKSNTIKCEGIINGSIKVNRVTNDMQEAVDGADVILVTTPANSHKEIALQMADAIKKPTTIVLNPGRTFGALEFKSIFEKNNYKIENLIAEAQTIIYTCRRTGEDSVNIITLKSDVLISTFDASRNCEVIEKLPDCLKRYFIPARSMIETSIGNVGMVLHCAPLLLNTGWTECNNSTYKYYYDGITKSVARLIEKIDAERVKVSELLGLKVESTKEWMERTYHVSGKDLYECIHNNIAYKTIDAPNSINHRYIMEDVPCGLVPLEAIGKKLGLEMKNTGLIIDLASSILEIDFRKIGRNLDDFKDLKILNTLL